MPGAAREFEALGRQAREEKWSFEDCLHEVLSGSMTTNDIRSKKPNINRRRIARFRTGWKHALKGRVYGEQRGVSWASAGNRCGVILGELPDEKRDLIYDLLVELHRPSTSTSSRARRPDFVLGGTGSYLTWTSSASHGVRVLVRSKQHSLQP